MAEQADWELLDWDIEQVHPGTVKGDALIVLGGTSPVPMDVEFHDLPPGIVPYDYWPVQIRGRAADWTIKVETPWSLERLESKFPKGIVGFVLVGATKRSHYPPYDAGANTG